MARVRQTYGTGKSKENFGHPGAVPNNYNIPAALQAKESGAYVVDPDGAKREVPGRRRCKGAAAPGAERPTLRTEPALDVAPTNRDVRDYMVAAAIRTLHMRHPMLRRVLPGAVVLLAAFIVQIPHAFSTQTLVYPGVDVLLSGHGQILTGMRVGLITHRAGAGVGGWPTSRLLSLDPRIRVVALFAPEHGLSGTLPAGATVPSMDGPIRVYSLYADTRRPTREMLAGIDALVFDLQDVGTRAYTYISTMALGMQAAAEYGKLFVVLDRPNPLDRKSVV